MTSAGFISPAQAELVELRQVERFFRGDVFREIRDAAWVKRELRFNVRLPASDFTSDPEYKAVLGSEKILVQGVVDCLYKTRGGSLKLLDYKTDHIPRSLSELPGAAENLLVQRHSQQLNYYARAIAITAATPVDECALWSFALAKKIPIEITGN